MRKKAVFVAATGQNVGKTTLCLGLLQGLKKRHESVGFIKPVGQQHVQVDGNTLVDKDAALFKEYFKLKSAYCHMSPIICKQGFTRDFLDDKIDEDALLEKIRKSYEKIKNENTFVLVEGTGHVGVGSLFNLNNAKVAKCLDLEMIIIATGGLGSAFDELSLNVEMCRSWNVPIRGIILNKVIGQKKEMIENYFPKTLQRWNIPLIGCVPYHDLLSMPSMNDFEILFQTHLLTGTQHRFRHFQDIRLVAGSLESFIEELRPRQLIITPACREDIITATIEQHLRTKVLKNNDCEFGMILTGKNPPRPELLERLESIDIPILYAPYCSFDVMKKISTTTKIQKEDISKIEKAIDIVEKNIDFSLI